MNKFFNRKCLNIIMGMLTALYILMLLYATLLRNLGVTTYFGSYIDYIKSSINLVPFSTIVSYFHRLSDNTINTSTVVLNLLGNIIMCVPLGFLIPYWIRKAIKWYKVVAITVAIIFVIEIAQLLTRQGVFDIDDLILNTVGAVLGYAIFTVVMNLAKKHVGSEHKSGV